MVFGIRRVSSDSLRFSSLVYSECMLIDGSSEFVNAQYRFVMKPTGDYTVHFADPDM